MKIVKYIYSEVICYGAVIGEVVTPDDEIYYGTIILKPNNLAGEIVSVEPIFILSVIENKEYKPFFVVGEFHDATLFSVVILNKNKYLFGCEWGEFEPEKMVNLIEITEKNYRFVNLIREKVYCKVRKYFITKRKISRDINNNILTCSYYKGLKLFQDVYSKIMLNMTMFVPFDNGKVLTAVKDIFNIVEKDDTMYEYAFEKNSPFCQWLNSYRDLGNSLDYHNIRISEEEPKANNGKKEWVFEF